MVNFDGYFEVLENARNPRWWTKVANAKNDDGIPTSCDAIFWASKETISELHAPSLIVLASLEFINGGNIPPDSVNG